MQIALAQLNPTIGDLQGNARKIADAAQQADCRGAALLLTPELSLCGYPPRDLLMQPNFIREMTAELERLALQLPKAIAVLVGLAIENPAAAHTGQKPLYNTTALLQGGQIKQFFHKQLLPTYDVFDEHRYFAPGSDSHLFEWNHPEDPAQRLRIGVTICEDLWNDVEFWGKRSYDRNPITELVGQKADLIVNLSGSPYSLRKQRLREKMLKHLAHRYSCPILYVNQVGGNDDLVFDGGSVGINRRGEVHCRAPVFVEALTLAEYRFETADLGDDASPRAIAPLPSCEAEELWQALVLGLRDYVHKCGFSSVVLGLSGGIDSALVAAIAAAALGPEQVLGILMPSPYSSNHSLSDAYALAQNLGIQTEKLPIAPTMNAFDETLASLFADLPFGVAEENLQSRIRGTLLMAVANKFGHLLVTTGNKSELAVGYCTLYGDMNGGLAAISDLPKTKVYELCSWLNQQFAHGPFQLPLCQAIPFNSHGSEIIPSHIITKPPSAELKPGQTDQDSLPPYELLDELLEKIICQHQSGSELVAAGFEPKTVARVLRLVHRAEFKRRQAAPGIKVTDRAFGTGWRMPIARWELDLDSGLDSD